jgi:hypothetical protein
MLKIRLYTKYILHKFPAYGQQVLPLPASPNGEEERSICQFLDVLGFSGQMKQKKYLL